MGRLVNIILQAIIVISIVVVVSRATDDAINVPEGILAALAEEAHTFASFVVVAIPATIARDRSQRLHAMRDDKVIVVAKMMATTTIAS